MGWWPNEWDMPSVEDPEDDWVIPEESEDWLDSWRAETLSPEQHRYQRLKSLVTEMF